MRWLALILAMAASPVLGQINPVPGSGDPRLQTIAYDPAQVVQLRVAPGYQLTVEFAPDERIENVAVGDGNAWTVTPNKRGDHLFIKPNESSASTNMTVLTDARTYNFELSPGSGSDTPFLLRFTYATPTAAASVIPDTASNEVGRYRVSGVKALRPSAIDDDGRKTYIEWPSDMAMPAVFAIDEHGQEMLVDGQMRDGRYVLDSVRKKLIFRLDREVAYATRRSPKKTLH